MKDFKTVLLILFFSIGFIFPSCEKDSCDGFDPTSVRYFDIQGLDNEVFQNDAGFEFIEPLDTIVFSETTGIYMIYQADYHAISLPAVKRTFSLINSMMACSFIAGYDGSKTEKLAKLSIITLNDFDEEHLTNSSINDLFEVQLDFYNEKDDLPLTEFLENQTENIKKQELLLRLKKAPTLNSEFHFRINVELSTGEKYETESSPVYFEN